ncbi:MAG TPA: hypothetical protein VLC10_03665 [Patescibacteria group bacterium]|nr:hypothetical protein [Patescibacteria group bacterium]
MYHVAFKDRRTMNLAIGRVSEYGENPVLARTVFTWDQLEDWWKTARGKKRQAFVDYWDGFNVPVSAFKPFFDGRFADLNAHERKLVAIARRLPRNAYVVATAKNAGRHILPHEVVHGLFAHLPAYRAEVSAAVRDAMSRGRLRRIVAALLRMGYGKQTLVDEINAYLVTRVEPGERMLGSGERALRPVLRGILRRHLGHVFRGEDGHRRAAELVHHIPFEGQA